MANPNPSPETRFKPGESANPGGKSSEQQLLEKRNAETATRIRGRLLDALDGATMDGADLSLIDPNVLRLIKDSEDRGLGAPKQVLDHSNSDGSLSRPTEIVLRGPNDNGNSRNSAEANTDIHGQGKV